MDEYCVNLFKQCHTSSLLMILWSDKYITRGLAVPLSPASRVMNQHHVPVKFSSNQLYKGSKQTSKQLSLVDVLHEFIDDEYCFQEEDCTYLPCHYHNHWSLHENCVGLLDVSVVQTPLRLALSQMMKLQRHCGQQAGGRESESPLHSHLNATSTISSTCIRLTKVRQYNQLVAMNDLILTLDKTLVQRKQYQDKFKAKSNQIV